MLIPTERDLAPQNLVVVPSESRVKRMLRGPAGPPCGTAEHRSRDASRGEGEGVKGEKEVIVPEWSLGGVVRLWAFGLRG